MPELKPDLSTERFNYATAMYLAHASAIAYEMDPIARARAELGLDTVDFKSVNESQCFVGHNANFSVVAIRGTEEPLDWLQNARVLQRVNADITGLIHSGFDNALTQVWGFIKEAVPRDRPLLITGHSL